MVKYIYHLVKNVTDYRKNEIYDFNQIEIKIRKATSNKDASDPSSSLLSEIARYTFDR